MTEKIRTVLVIERQEQTIVRRWRRTTSAQAIILSSPHPVQAKRKSLRRWWNRLALKSATVVAPLARRLKRGGKVER